MKKRVLFVLPSFDIGGTTVSVKNLILLLDKSKYEVSVLAMVDSGKLRYLYNDVKQIQTSFLLRTLTAESWRTQKSLFGKIIGGFIRLASHINYVKCALFKLAAKSVVNHKEYDTIVACQEWFCTRFVSYIKGVDKVAWVRCDYTRYINIIGQDESKIYASFKNIVCVSELTKQKFCQIHPYFADKCIAINNPQSAEFIISQAVIDDKDPRFTNEELFKIVSIGRFDPIKRFDKIPEIAYYLKSRGLGFRWYIVGGGSSFVENSIERKIEQYQVEDKVVLLGAKSNPHYYIKQSDLLVVLSSSEACPRVVNEAKILHVPVVCADFDTAKEYIINGIDGVIASIDDIAEAVAEMIENKGKYHDVKNRISQFRFDNEDLMKMVDSVLA